MCSGVSLSRFEAVCQSEDESDQMIFEVCKENRLHSDSNRFLRLFTGGKDFNLTHSLNSCS